MTRTFGARLGATVLGAAILGLQGLGCAEPAEPCSNCNVLLISADTLRADHLGAYGYERETSPNIDAFARESRLYRDVTAQAPWTLSSHMSMLTGLYSSSHGVVDKTKELADATPTLADLLHEAGYTTAAFTGGGYVGSAYNYHTFDLFNEKGGVDGSNFPRMLDWLRRNGDRRFFLFWHDFLVHCPYAPSPTFDLFADSRYEGPVCVEPDPEAAACDEERSWSCVNKCGGYFWKIKDRMGPEDYRYVRAKYDGEIRELDRRVEQILRTLEDLGIREETIVVFTSDHGESFADRKHRAKVGHGLMYEEVLRVPLMIDIPGHPPGVDEHPVETIDILPTVLEALGMEVPDVDGRSLLRGDETAPREDDPVYSESFHNAERYSLRVGDLKLIHDAKQESRELYDLAEDPGEKRNLYGTGYPAQERLEKLLEARASGALGEAGRADIDERTRDRLRALGYAP